jgi:hypothetical protein
MAVQTATSSLERELDYRRKLTQITNQINSADSIQQILMTLSRAADDLRRRHEEPGALLAPQGRRRAERDPGPEDLRLDRRLHRPLPPDDQHQATPTTRPSSPPSTRASASTSAGTRRAASGRRRSSPPRSSSTSTSSGCSSWSTSGAAAPSRPAGRRGRRGARQDPGHRLLQPAPAARTNKPSKFGALLDKGLVSEKDVERGVSAARVNQVDVARSSSRRCDVPKEELGALAQFYGCAAWQPGRLRRSPRTSASVSARLPGRRTSASPSSGGGTVRVMGRGPYDLTRLDAIKAMNLAPRYEFLVGLRDDILAYLHSSYGEAGPAVEEADLTRIINDLGSGEEGEVEGEEERSPEPEVDETDSGIVRLCNQIIIDAYNRGRFRHPRRALRRSRPHHRPPPDRRRLPEVPRDARPAPQRPRPAAQDHGQAGHRGEAQAAGRQDPLQAAPMG